MNRADTLTFCWRIERRDGAGLALTSHDAPVALDGIMYEPSPGLLPARIERRAGLAPASADIDAALSAAGLTDEDLELGRWNGAAIRLDAVRWDDPDGPPVTLIEGEIGEVSSDGDRFGAELIGPAARLEAPVCPSTSSHCRAALGDRDCRVDLAGRRLIAVVVQADGERVTVDPPAAAGHGGGRMVVMDGPSCGWRSSVAGVEEGTLVLRDLPRRTLEAGTRLWIDQGCDKTVETCRTRFSNVVNFRGEPHLPGNDLLTRYPGG